MRFFKHVPALLPLLSCASSMQLVIPEVELAVQSMLHNLSSYVDYKTPTHLPPQHVDPQSYVAQAGTTPYWYETINHQGISAFGPSGYSVFRNVKNYGAIGNGVTDDTVSICTHYLLDYFSYRPGRYQRSDQCWRPLWSRLCEFNDHAGSHIFSCRNLFNFISHQPCILHPAHWESQCNANDQSNRWLWWVCLDRCGPILHIQSQLGFYQCILPTDQELHH